MSLIKIENLYKSFGTTQVLNGINLSIEQGQHSSIVGASGSGKSTLLYLLGGLDKPAKGEITVDGKMLSKLSENELALYRSEFIGFVFQFHFLLPSMNCMQNLMLPCEIAGKNKTEIKNRIEKLADKLNVTHCLKKFPFEISGGEQQRVNIIRALSLAPKLLLCDEPTGNLDSQNSQNVLSLLTDLAEQEKSTLLVVTHDIQIANQLNRKITIEDGQIIG
jgi:lipoprotein-releasing system ATP-binding protein